MYKVEAVYYALNDRYRTICKVEAVCCALNDRYRTICKVEAVYYALNDRYRTICIKSRLFLYKFVMHEIMKCDRQ